jgi:hypothetical protein
MSDFDGDHAYDASDEESRRRNQVRFLISIVL